MTYEDEDEKSRGRCLPCVTMFSLKSVTEQQPPTCSSATVAVYIWSVLTILA